MSLKHDLAKLPKETLAEIQRQAEIYLAAQLQAGIAADTRAVSFVSLMAAATVALGGAGVALLIADHQSPRLGIVAMVMALGFVLSMACAIMSARPVSFEYSGGLPRDWEPDAHAGRPYEESLTELLENYDERASKNIATLGKNSAWMQWALRTALVTLALGAIMAVIFLSLGRH